MIELGLIVPVRPELDDTAAYPLYLACPHCGKQLSLPAADGSLQEMQCPGCRDVWNVRVTPLRTDRQRIAYRVSLDQL